MRDDGQPWRETGADHAGAVGAPTGPVRAMLLVEIGDFTALRRTLGLADADLVVSHLAERVAAALPDATVATIGRTRIEIGWTAPDRGALDRAVSLLHRTVDQPVVLGDNACRLSLRIGVATAPDKAGGELALVEAAEAALARAEPGGVAETGCAPLVAATGADRTIGRELTAATARDELFLQYQPKLHLRRQQITSIEALIRWRHPERGLVLPGGFIPAAERSGAIKALTLWTLRQVVADQRVLAGAGHDLPVFVNIAGVLLSDSDFVDTAIALVRASGARLGFEITETSVIRDPEIAISHLKRLADIGVVIAIDDYGAGLSSLAYLKQLPARELKIDKLFVTQLSSSHRDPLIVRSTIDLAHALEMEVVAEGVETPTSLALLSVMGCDMVQGFLISRPLVLDGLVDYLRDEVHRSLLDEARSPLQRLAAVRARA